MLKYIPSKPSRKQQQSYQGDTHAILYKVENGEPDGSPIFPYDSPANIAFGKDGSILLTNHAFATMIPANFTVLNVFVEDKESPLVRPSIP